jgi:hypothetical protein
LYLLHCLIQRYPKSAFIYRHGAASAGFFLYYNHQTWSHASISQAFTQPLLIKLLTAGGRRPIWAVLDGVAAIPTGAEEFNQILLISPGSQRTRAVEGMLRTLDSEEIVNPPWTLDELELVRRHAFQNKVGTDQLKEAYHKWGGVPRTVFAVSMNPSKEEKLEEELSRAANDLAEMFNSAGKAMVDPNLTMSPHFILIPGQRVPANVDDSDETTQFLYGAFSWATEWMIERCWEDVKIKKGEIPLLEYLRDPKNNAVSRGLAFEPHVMITLQNVGLHGPLKQLSKVQGQAVAVEMRHQKLPRLRARTFRTLDPRNPPSLQAGEFLLPLSKTYPAVDFLVPEYGLMVQVTIGKKHGVKWKWIQEAIDSGIFDLWKEAYADATGKAPKIRLVFLCDDNNYDTFSRQPYKNSKNEAYKDEKPMNDLVDQYAWKLSVDAQLGIRMRERGAATKDQKEKEAAEDWGIDDLPLPPPPPPRPQRGVNKKTKTGGK